jgi:hypothetical protein
MRREKLKTRKKNTQGETSARKGVIVEATKALREVLYIDVNYRGL